MDKILLSDNRVCSIIWIIVTRFSLVCFHCREITALLHFICPHSVFVSPSLPTGTVQFTTGEDVSIGVYHGGILIYRGRVRIGRFLWPQLVKLLYKAKTFTIVTRAINVDLKIQSASLAKSSGLLRGEKRRSNDLFNQLFTLNFQCADPRLSRRLWESCTAQHSFFR